MMFVLLALAFAVADPEEVLVQARDKVLERTDRLPNYTCIQTVNRTFLKREKPEYPAPSCDQMSAERTRKTYSLKVEGTDRLRLDVKVSAGNEIGSWAGASHFQEGDVDQFVKGPFGTGPFGTFLSDIFASQSIQFRFLGADSGLFRYRFQVPLEASHYRVQAGADWRVTGYDGVLEVDPNTFALRHLTIRTAELPEETGACEAATSVDYAGTQLGTREFLLPLRSSLHFLMRDTTESDVSTAYSGCRQFLGEAKVSFGPDVPAGESPVAPPVPLSIPAGLSVSLELTEDIDTDKAAAGDVVVAKVVKPVRDTGSGVVLFPAGSKVSCRIVSMEHWQNQPAHFLIALQLETVEVNGHLSPLYALLKNGEEDLMSRGRVTFLRPRGQSQLAGTFVFLRDGPRYVMRRGFAMKWTTVSAPL